MKQTFINHTNHPAANWSERQREAAEEYGEIIDIPFPNISPHITEEEIDKLAKKSCQEILAERPAAVLCQGEFNYSYALITYLKEHDITVLAACSERAVVTTVDEDGNTRRDSVFRFVKFRAY